MVLEALATTAAKGASAGTFSNILNKILTTAYGANKWQEDVLGSIFDKLAGGMMESAFPEEEQRTKMRQYALDTLMKKQKGTTLDDLFEALGIAPQGKASGMSPMGMK